MTISLKNLAVRSLTFGVLALTVASAQDISHTPIHIIDPACDASDLQTYMPPSVEPRLIHFNATMPTVPPSNSTADDLVARYLVNYEDFEVLDWWESRGIVRHNDGTVWWGYSCSHVGHFQCLAIPLAARIYGALSDFDAPEAQARFAIAHDEGAALSELIRMRSPVIPHVNVTKIEGDFRLPTNVTLQHVEKTYALWQFLGIDQRNDDFVEVNTHRLTRDDYDSAFQDHPNLTHPYCLNKWSVPLLNNYTCNLTLVRDYILQARQDPRVPLIIDEVEAAFHTQNITKFDSDRYLDRIRGFLGLPYRH